MSSFAQWSSRQLALCANACIFEPERTIGDGCPSMAIGTAAVVGLNLLAMAVGLLRRSQRCCRRAWEVDLDALYHQGVAGLDAEPAPAAEGGGAAAAEGGGDGAFE